MRARTTVGSVVAGMVMATFLSVPAAAPAGESYLLPDLTVRPPTAIEATKKRLNFGTIVANRGLGPLEIRAFEKQVNCPVAGNFNATGFYAPQIVYNDINGNGLFEPESEGDPETNAQDIDKRASCIVYHQPHGHYHYKDFARFTLKRINKKGKTGKRVSISKKVSFCVIDTDFVYPGLPGVVDDGGPYGGYCDADPPHTTMGISVGYGDHYGIGTQGQSLRINGLPKGEYCLVNTADPKNKIVEAGTALGEVPQPPYNRKKAKNSDRQKLRLNPAREFVKLLGGKC